MSVLRRFSGLALVAVALVAVGCSPAAPSGMATPAAGGETIATTPAPQTVEVMLGELYIEPKMIEVQGGTDLTLKVYNEGVIAHDLQVEGVGQTALLNPKTGEDLNLGVLPAGEYNLFCRVAGHAPGGMTARLTVTEAPEGAAHADPSHTPATPGVMTADEMDALHMAVIAAFPAETQGKGNLPMEPVIVDGVKVFELTATELDWEVEPGKFRKAMAYNGQVPGPQIRVDLGDTVRIVFHNELHHSSSIHFHGLLVPNNMDGVPGLTQDPVKPGETFVYEFTVRNNGSHMYHSHHDAATQVPMGLLGAFIVNDPADQVTDQDYVMILNDGPLGYTINGKGFPATEPLVLNFNETIRIRYMNEGLQIHPMHLHGIVQLVIALDGNPVPAPYLQDTVMVAPGQRVDV
ncbi:MAG: multicopper oxidase domain-containing protein, partial [Chloroflexi bacterium]|nr:multicopper oxidase domain-containing protein [Chloroflexota bacterium]